MTSLMASDNNLQLRNVDDAMTVLSSGLPGCIFCIDDVSRDFFDLKTGLLGDVFQKFVNYRFRAAFVIPLGHSLGKRVDELMRDHTQHSCIRFFASTQDASDWLRQSLKTG